jgi:CheY-like chemotaxis protein
MDAIGLQPSPALRKLKVLVADDNAAARQIAGEIFRDWGMAVDLVASGPEAISAIEMTLPSGQPYDLLLLDWKMPGMDGIDTIEAIRRIPGLARLPVTLIVTAYGNDEFMAELGKAEISAFLTKPVDARALLGTITNLFLDAPQGEAEAAQGGVPMVSRPCAVCACCWWRTMRSTAKSPRSCSPMRAALRCRGKRADRLRPYGPARRGLCRDPDGCADARDGRHRSDRHHPPALVRRCSANSGHDRPCL